MEWGADPAGLRLAGFLLEHGDATLAERMRAEQTGVEENALHVYWARRLDVQRAVLAGDLDGVRTQTEGLADLPETYAEGLWLARQVALAASGRDVDPEGPALERLLDRLAWTRPIASRSWAAFDALLDGRVPPAWDGDAAPPARVAGPQEEKASAVAGPTRYERGYVPVEWMPAGVHTSRGRGIVRAFAALFLVPLGLLVLLLSGLLMLAGSGRDVLAWAIPVGILAVGAPLTLGLRALLTNQSSFSAERARRAGSTIRGIVRADGQGLLEDRFLVVSFADSAPGVSSVLLLVCVGPAVEWTVNRTLYALIPGLVVAWSAVRLAVGARTAERAHGASPEAWRASVERIPGWLALNDGRAGWLGLACLWRGDRDGSRAAWQAMLLHRDKAESLLAWLDAGDGRLDFAHLIARPMPESLGPAYRFGVTLALAALASGESEPLDPERSDALRALGRSLPNRFGDLLLALVDRLEDPALPLPDDLVWFDAVWPGLWAGPGVDDG